MMRWQTTILALAGAGMLCLPAFGADIARPGTVNYVEGAVSVDGQALARRSVGSIELNPGEELATQTGKAEILLTPGVFLRVDDQSEVKMISPDLTHTQVAVERGRAGVEVDEIYPQNNLDVLVGGVSTQLVKPGYYEFNANQPTVMVFQGKAAVEVGDGKYKVVKDHHEFALTPSTTGKPLAREKPADFNARAAQDDLYNWNSLRSEYLAEANNQIAGEYAGGPGFYPGWYWDPYAWDYTFIGWDPFWSPFGWGFYPFGWYGGWGGWYGGRWGYRGHGAAPAYHGGLAYHGAVAGGGFHGGGFGGGGFHGGGFGGGGGRR